MRKLMIAGLLMFAVSFAFGQKRVERDPSYSIHNYKHPNKAAYAREHDLDKSTKLEVVNVSQSDDYKHPSSKRKMKKKYSITTQASDRKGKSYKHPQGL